MSSAVRISVCGALPVGDVVGVRDRLAAERLDLLDDGVGDLAGALAAAVQRDAEVVDHDLGALARELERVLAADARGPRPVTMTTRPSQMPVMRLPPLVGWLRLIAAVDDRQELRATRHRRVRQRGAGDVRPTRSEPRNRQAPATSAGVPIRPSGTVRGDGRDACRAAVVTSDACSVATARR